MNRRTALLAMLALPLAACATRLNPMNWFGRSRRKAKESAVTVEEQADGRLLIREVTELHVEKVDSGAIVRASGLPPTQGWWDAELVAQNRGRPDEEGVLTFRFLVWPPLTATRTSTPRSRRLSAAAFVPNARLDTISTIVVQGQSNSLSSGR
jgi:hypothetical protein